MTHPVLDYLSQQRRLVNKFKTLVSQKVRDDYSGTKEFDVSDYVGRDLLNGLRQSFKGEISVNPLQFPELSELYFDTPFTISYYPDANSEKIIFKSTEKGDYITSVKAETWRMDMLLDRMISLSMKVANFPRENILQRELDRLKALATRDSFEDAEMQILEKALEFIHVIA